MDGFHLYRSQLDAMSDPAEAHARRGAPWTFDAAAFVDCVRWVRGGGDVLVPSFDHGVGDPVPDSILVRVHGTFGKVYRGCGQHLGVGAWNVWQRVQGVQAASW